MNFSVYEPFSYSEQTLIATNVACFFDIESYEYHKRWRDIGSFTLVVPATTYGIKSVREDMILFVDEGGEGNTNDCLIINEVKDDGIRITFSGTDLKGLLSFRTTLFPQEEIEAGTYGFDVRQGSTGSIIAGYIDYNCISATDPRRNIPGLRIGWSYGGLENDTYMSRLQPLNEVVTALCKNADIGWDITFSPSAIGDGYVFNIVEGSDRTNMTGRYKCVFADYLHNATAITKESKSAERRNVIWTVNGSDTNKAVVTSIYKEEESWHTEGFWRRETVLTANCDLDLTEAYVESKTADMVDKMQVNFELVDPTMYGSRFLVGDKVTVMKDGQSYDRRVIEVVKRYSAQKRSIGVNLGDIPAQKFFDKTSGDLNSRADDIKELALENAATKKASITNSKVHFGTCHPDRDPELAAKENDLYIEISYVDSCDNQPVVVSLYQYRLQPDNSDTEENTENEGSNSNVAMLNGSGTSSGGDRTVRAISIQTEPTKKEYKRGEPLDLTGGVLLVTYSDGNITTVNMTDSSVTASGYDPQVNGPQTVTLHYSGKSVELTVSCDVYKWELVGRTMNIADVLYELNIRSRRTNGMYL